MSDAVKPALHGRDHCPGGVDPIPARCLTPNMPWVRRYKEYGAGLIVAGAFLDDEVTLGAGTGNGPDGFTGSDDWEEYFEFTSNFQVNHIINGFVEVWAGVSWDTHFDGPAWFYIHDGEGYPDAAPGHDRPTNYGQLGAVTIGWWKQRMGDINGPLQVDIAQFSGSNKEIDAWYIEYRWAGPYTGPDRDDNSNELP